MLELVYSGPQFILSWHVPSRFVGVSTLERKYVASGPGSIKLGSFFKEKDAARVYDRACIYQVA